MEIVKEIDTNYKGYNFRSRLEVRYAVFLDSFNEKWYYEVEGCELKSGWHLLDFWLLRLECWFNMEFASCF